MYIGRLDKRLYQCITEDICTDEVIITERQIQHIKDRHPESYFINIEYLKEAIIEPDYIIEDKHKKTGLIIKKINVKGNYIQVVLRICTSNDKQDYKNSIISSWQISEARLQNYLRNKKILYKRV